VTGSSSSSNGYYKEVQELPFVRETDTAAAVVAVAGVRICTSRLLPHTHRGGTATMALLALRRL
jgi:hypothetical protein